MREWVKWSAETVWGVGCLLATMACGTSPSTPAMGSAGTAGTANGLSNAGGTKYSAAREATLTVDTATSTTQYSACVTYTKAQCQRRMTDCGERDNSEDPCSWALDRCPDALFSPGSSWTVESLLSCAEEWKEFPCEDIREFKRPACAAPAGTRQLDEPCLFANQCASNICTQRTKEGQTIPDYPGCGVCGEASDVGGPCAVDGYECKLDLSCVSRKCVKRDLVGIVGERCENDSTCGGYGVSCREDPSDGEKRCLEFPREGESCEDYSCADGYLCTADNVCAEGPAEGETCVNSATGQCAKGLVCTGKFEDPPTTCIAGRALGETCSNIPKSAPRGNCEAGLRCDCGEVDCNVASGVCRELRGEGEDCAASDTMCAHGTLCVDDTCVALEYQPKLVAGCPL